jgi:hypothetical protein
MNLGLANLFALYPESFRRFGRVVGAATEYLDNEVIDGAQRRAGHGRG